MLRIQSPPYACDSNNGDAGNWSGDDGGDDSYAGNGMIVIEIKMEEMGG
jgi:hypothetical protein